MSAARSCLSTGLAASRPGVVERVLLFLRSLAAARPPSAVVEAFPDAGHEGGLLDVVRLGVGAQWGKARPRIQALQRFPQRPRCTAPAWRRWVAWRRPARPWRSAPWWRARRSASCDPKQGVVVPPTMLPCFWWILVCSCFQATDCRVLGASYVVIFFMFAAVEYVTNLALTMESCL